MSDFKIIKLKPRDWKDYKELRLRALKAEPQAFLVSYEEELAIPDEKWQQRLQKAGKGRSWILFAKDTSDRLTSMVGGYRSDDNIKNHSAEIWGAYVDKDSRGKGVGKNLMENMIGELKNNPEVEIAVLEVSADQVPAQKLYESLGFEVKTTYPVKMGDGKEHQIFRMEKSLK